MHKDFLWNTSDLANWSLFSPSLTHRRGTVLRAHDQRWSLWWGKWRRTHMNTRVSAITQWRDTCLCRRSVRTQSTCVDPTQMHISLYKKCIRLMMCGATSMKVCCWKCIALALAFSLPAAFFSFFEYNLSFLFLLQARLCLPGWSTTACTIVSPRGSPWFYLTPNLEGKWWAGLDVLLDCLTYQQTKFVSDKNDLQKAYIRCRLWRVRRVSVQSVSISELLSDLFPVRAGLTTAVFFIADSVDDFYGQNFQVRPSTGRCSGRWPENSVLPCCKYHSPDGFIDAVTFSLFWGESETLMRCYSVRQDGFL